MAPGIRRAHVAAVDGLQWRKGTMRTYTVEWTFSESTTYRTTVDAEHLAELTGCTVEQIEACATGDEVLDLDHELCDRLAEIEEPGDANGVTELSYTNEREVDSLAILTDS